MNNADPEKEYLSNDLYQYIPPPNPLVPKNLYTDDEPKSHLQMLQIRRFAGNEANFETDQSSRFNNEPVILPSISISEFCDDNSDKIVYRRFPPQSNRYAHSSLIDIRKLLRLEESLRLSSISGNGTVEPFMVPEDRTLVFESRFESGNLSMAIKKSDFDYLLVLQNDINTKGHTQWFYFRVSNTTANLPVRFNIINLGKKDSLFNYGMKVLIYSEKENALNGTGWFRGGVDILYYKNNLLKPDSEKSFYSLTFSYTFVHTEDTVYFAYTYPYTYTDLMLDLKKIEEDPRSAYYTRRKLLCQTIGGNRCELLTITNPCDPVKNKAKRAVFISARVHPGESVSSWMMKGVIDFLTGPSPEAFLLREHFIFKLVPMLNPDGVINGNYRCSLLGVDLNRRWKTPSKSFHPTIYNSKMTIKNLMSERPVTLICDLHGHSRRKNIFIYGCNVNDRPSLTRAFPYILSKICPYFSYPYCSFKVQKSKEATLRIAMFKETRIPAVYTIESSFCGANFGEHADRHFTCNDYSNMGEFIGKALIVYAGVKSPEVVATVEKTTVLDELEENEELLKNPENDSSSGSESEPSEDNFEVKEMTNVMQRAFSPIKKKTGKRNISPVRSRVSSIKAIPAAKPKKELNETLKCGNCGFPEINGHVCIKPKKRMKVVATVETPITHTYTNHHGKLVRDQATQTNRVLRNRNDRYGTERPQWMKETINRRNSNPVNAHIRISSSNERQNRNQVFPNIPKTRMSLTFK